MDRFGIGYLVLAVVLFTLPVQTCGTLTPTEVPTRATAVIAPGEVSAETRTRRTTPPVAAEAAVVAIIRSGGSTFRVLVGADQHGRVWSAAFDDTLPE